jgi:predicted transposase YbfD/YdcC
MLARRATGPRAACPLQLVSAFASEARLTLGQRASDSKSNEIPAVRALLALLSLQLQGGPVTLDALPAPRQTAPALLEPKADYIMALKGNQGDLHDDVRTLLDDPAITPYSRAKTGDGDPGRIERREASRCDNLGWLQQQHDWPGLAGIGTLTATREDKASGTVQVPSRYYLLSRVLDAHEFLAMLRNHWAIENSLPWVLGCSPARRSRPRPKRPPPRQPRHFAAYGPEHDQGQQRQRLPSPQIQTCWMG